MPRANLLILDEPTNHLDVESIEALEDAIERYDGTVMIVSHDRALLRALADRVWVLHDRHITAFDGSFGEWEVVSAERAHAAQVKAAEEAAMHRMRERQTVTRRDTTARAINATRFVKRNETRKPPKQEVAQLERTISELTKTLADPELYMTVGWRGICNAARRLTSIERRLRWNVRSNVWTTRDRASRVAADAGTVRTKCRRG